MPVYSTSSFSTSSQSHLWKQSWNLFSALLLPSQMAQEQRKGRCFAYSRCWGSWSHCFAWLVNDFPVNGTVSTPYTDINLHLAQVCIQQSLYHFTALAFQRYYNVGVFEDVSNVACGLKALSSYIINKHTHSHTYTDIIEVYLWLLE